MFNFKFPNFRQYSYNDCGPACIVIVAKFYKKYYPLEYIREQIGVNRDGSTLFALAKCAESIGFKTLSLKTSFEHLKKLPLPFIIFWKQRHFLVIYKVSDNFIYASDPSFGLIKFSEKEFEENWSYRTGEGEVLLLETTPDFYNIIPPPTKDKIGFRFLLKYFSKYKQLVAQLFIGLIVTTVFSVIFPFLTQSLVDIGINQKNLNFVYLILIAQIFLFVSQSAIGFIRSWIFMHIATKVNISLVSDFLFKLMRLPIMFVDSRTLGDIYQRISDLGRLQGFISSTTLNFIFSFISLILFSFMLITYSTKIFVIFIIGSVLGVLWVFLFLKKRKELDYKRFYESSASQNSMVQILTGIREIKLSSAEEQKRSEWEKIQTNIFKISIKSLYWSQMQQFGSLFLNQFKNILITVIAATQVINGDITLGMMMAISYIIGQISAPIEQFIGLVQTFQDAKISLARVSEVYNCEEEEKPAIHYIPQTNLNESIYFRNVSFKYFKTDENYLLSRINFEIPKNKITAIVGSSGSGKTTLLKLILKLYNVNEGGIYIGNNNIDGISPSEWRKQCGSVMQDGYVFSDTIENNIILGAKKIDKERLEYSIRAANLNEFLETLPKGMDTLVGMMGEGVSQGQKQRILIARAIYKNPNYVFFDEATSDLDSQNENQIMENLDGFFKNKTVLLIAHRLSTIKNADNIIVLNDGIIAEQGNYDQLIALNGVFPNIFKNQT
ncbi:MAG: peptidase domain-containing ABC transporter [Ignavibacteria bacterium]|nr:peptidase domain-containing ABC transporter [Ignavibacteria bacterium]